MSLLSTSRLTINFVTLKDASFFINLMNQPSYIKNIGDRNIKTILNAEYFIKDRIIKSYEDNGYGYYIIKLKDTQQQVGVCGLVNRTEMNLIDIGYAMVTEFTNRGYDFEATEGLNKYAQNVFKVNEIVAIISQVNYKSIALIEKIGMQYVKNMKLPNDDVAC